MVRRGSFSFVAMLVINPVVILFYQNCSMAPTSQARSVASVSEARELPKPALDSHKQQAKATCADGKEACRSSDIE